MKDFNKPRKYIDSSGIPEIGKPFVSSNKAGQNLRIRVILSPDSKVRLFEESPSYRQS